MKLSELIERLEDLQESIDDDAEVLGAFQPTYPLAGEIIGACVLHDDESAQPLVWIAVGSPPPDTSPYAPRAAFEETQ
jgi:hypothetical protein